MKTVKRNFYGEGKSIDTAGHEERLKISKIAKFESDLSKSRNFTDDFRVGAGHKLAPPPPYKCL